MFVGKFFGPQITQMDADRMKFLQGVVRRGRTILVCDGRRAREKAVPAQVPAASVHAVDVLGVIYGIRPVWAIARRRSSIESSKFPKAFNCSHENESHSFAVPSR